MIEAFILVCALGVDASACSERSAVDVIHVKVQDTICTPGAEPVVIGMPGSQLEGRVLKIVCGHKA